jgi:hypothetical protein
MPVDQQCQTGEGAHRLRVKRAGLNLQTVQLVGPSTWEEREQARRWGPFPSQLRPQPRYQRDEVRRGCPGRQPGQFSKRRRVGPLDQGVTGSPDESSCVRGWCTKPIHSDQIQAVQHVAVHSSSSHHQAAVPAAGCRRPRRLTDKELGRRSLHRGGSMNALNMTFRGKPVEGTNGPAETHDPQQMR